MRQPFVVHLLCTMVYQDMRRVEELFRKSNVESNASWDMRGAAVAVKHPMAYRIQATPDASSGSGDLTLGKEGRSLAQTRAEAGWFTDRQRRYDWYMSTTSLPDRIRAFLAEPQPAVIASVRPDGQPVSVATWYLLDGDEVLVNMDASRRRLAYLRSDPRVSLTVLDGADWYTHVSLQGRIVRWRDDEGLVDIDRLSRHYRGVAYPTRDRTRVSAWVAVERWHGWGHLRG